MDTDATIIMGALLAVGAVLKHAIPAFPNRFIPLVTLLAGTAAMLWWVGCCDKHAILNAVLVSLAATGLHSTTKNLTGKDL
jgi:hypothetical protein